MFIEKELSQRDLEMQEPEEQKTTKSEPEAEESETKEQETINEQEVSQATEEQEATKNLDKQERRPTEFKVPRRSLSVAEKAKIFEQDTSSPTLPLQSPRKQKIVLPLSESPKPIVSSRVQEGQLIELPSSPPTSEFLPPPPLEPPPSPPSEFLPPPPLEPPPPPPSESPPASPSEPPLLEPFSPEPALLESSVPKPPESEPPLLEVTQIESLPIDQTAENIQQRSSTMPVGEKKKLVKKVTEK